MAVSVLPDPGVISFARGVPSPDMFPLELLAACAEHAVREHGRVALNYGPAAGYAPLQAWVAERHGVAPERVLLTPGSLIGLNLVVRRLCPGREALVEVAVAHDLPVFEDDPYGLVRIDGEPQPMISTLLREAGRDDLAIFAASFSKTVAPGLRVGYLVLPEHLVADISTAVSRTYVSPPMLPQAQLHAFLSGGHLEPHLADLGVFLRPRRDALVEALDGLGDAIRFTRPGGGYFLWLELPDHVDATELERQARAAGVTFVPGAGFYAGEPRRSTARLAFSYSTVEEIREGAARLVELIRAAL